MNLWGLFMFMATDLNLLPLALQYCLLIVLCYHAIVSEIFEIALLKILSHFNLQSKSKQIALLVDNMPIDPE